jgi:outer membrane protein OmpA-like peptidoglycan-associated protein
LHHFFGEFSVKKILTRSVSFVSVAALLIAGTSIAARASIYTGPIASGISVTNIGIHSAQVSSAVNPGTLNADVDFYYWTTAVDSPVDVTSDNPWQVPGDVSPVVGSGEYGPPVSPVLVNGYLTGLAANTEYHVYAFVQAIVPIDELNGGTPEDADGDGIVNEADQDYLDQAQEYTTADVTFTTNQEPPSGGGGGGGGAPAPSPTPSVTPTPTASPTPTPTPTPTIQPAELMTVTFKVSVYFDGDSSAITAAAQKAIKSVLNRVPDNAMDVSVSLRGFVSPTAVTNYDKKLSAARAANTKKLLAKGGLGATFSTAAVGVDKSVAAPKARRVDVVVTYTVEVTH